MYEIYVENTSEDVCKLLYSLTEENYNEFFEFIDTHGIKIEMLKKIKCLTASLGLYTYEIMLLRNEVGKISKIKETVFSVSLEKACEEALGKGYSLRCSRRT